MNLNQLRVAITETVRQLRPTNYPSETTSTALQAHLDALLKEELRALTGQAQEGYFAGFAEQNEKFAQDMGLRKDAPWYPDDSGEWVEVADDCVTCPVPDDTNINYLLRNEREGESYTACPNTASNLCWDLDPEENSRIAAYKVVKP